MDYKLIDLNNYPRREQYEYFKTLAYPYFGFTVNVDLTDFLAKVKVRGADFHMSFCYCIERAANRVPEFKQRLCAEGIREYEWTTLSCTLAKNDGTYCYCDLDARLSIEEYLPRALEIKAQALSGRGIEESADADSQLFCSCTPWLSYTALVQPVPSPADSNPRITWGRYFEQAGRMVIPVSVLCNHALMDGRHAALFYEALDNELSGLF